MTLLVPMFPKPQDTRRAPRAGPHLRYWASLTILGLTYDAATEHNKTRKAHLAKMEAGQISAVTRQTLKWLCQSLRCKKQTIMPAP